MKKSKKRAQKRGEKSQQYRDSSKIVRMANTLYWALADDFHAKAERHDKALREFMRAYLKTPVYPGAQIAKEQHVELLERRRKEKERDKRVREKEAKLEAKLAKEAREGALP